MARFLTVANKRDKRRVKARRNEQRRRDQANRARIEQTEALLAEVVDYISNVQAVATDLERPPTDFAVDLRTAFESSEMGQALSIPALAWASAAEVARDVDEARSSALAGAVAALLPQHPGAAWWSGALYYYAGEVARAEEIATRALAGTDDGEALNLVGHLRREKGALAAAVGLAYSRVEADPTDEDAQRQLARSLILIGARRDEVRAGSSPCGCGSGLSWDDCCRPAEIQAWARFTDRSTMQALDTQIDEFVTSRPDLDSWRQSCIDEWVARVGDFDRVRGETDAPPIAQMAKECSSIRGPQWPDDDVRAALDDDGNSVLSRFAAEADAPLELALLARQWQVHGACGLWQVVNPITEPGLWVTEMITRRSLFVSVPPALRSGLARWSVLAAMFVPDDGVWRAVSTLAALTPDEGDLAAEVAQATIANVVRGLAIDRQLKGGRHLPERLPQLEDPPPWGVLAGMADPLDPSEARLSMTVMAVALPAMLSEVQRSNRSFPAPSDLGTNLDNWLDEALADLDGVSPRQASTEAKGAALLERLLRRWEYQRDLDGGSGIDVDAIRVALADEDGEEFAL